MASTGVEPNSAPSLSGRAPDRRTRILEVATRRFAEHGFEATTVRQIADDVKILSGSLYHHFANKEEMLNEIVRDAVVRLRDHAAHIAALPRDAEYRLVALIVVNLREVTRDQAIHTILYNERKLFRKTPEFAYLITAKKQAYREWRTILEDGVRDGLFCTETDLYLVISTIIRMLGAAADWLGSEANPGAEIGDAPSPEALTAFYLRFILRAVRAPARAGAEIPQLADEDLALPVREAV